MSLDTDVLGGLPNAVWSCDEVEVEVNGLKFHVLEARRRDVELSSRALVMLHGMTSHGDAWRPVVAALRNADRVLCPDLRGHGRSSWTTEGYWLADYADDVVGIVDALGIEAVDLLGQSLGARVAMVLAGRLADRARTVMLCDTGPEVARAAAEAARSAFESSKRKTAFNDSDELLQFLREEQPDWAEVSIALRAERLYRRNWAGKLVNRGDPDVGWLLGRAGLRERDDMWRGLRDTSAAILVIRGTRSYLLDDDLAQRMCAAAAQSTYVELPLGHYLPYEDPEAIAAVVDEFLQANA